MMATQQVLTTAAVCLSLMVVGTTFAQNLVPAKPLDPVEAILDAFRTHEIVALGEGAHGNEQGHAFRQSLIRDPRFSATVNDIVVEFGNARFQDVIDRFVRGEQVSGDALRQVWQDTTQVTTVWDRPIYEEFFHVVRVVNAPLPLERRLRVLLGDPPIDWDQVHTFEDFNKWMANGNRDRYPAEVIRREVLAKKRRALVIYGEAHLARVPAGQSIVQLLESIASTKVFTIASPISMPTATDLTTLQADAASWPVPSIAILRGTVLGRTNLTSYFSPPMSRGGKPGPVNPDQPQLPLMEDQFDAILYLGHPSTIMMSQLSPTRCADTAYIEMRLQRLALMPPPLAKIQGDRVKGECPAK